MANDRLADLTPADVLEIAGSDPRVKLMERLYSDPVAKKEIQRHAKRLFPQATIPEIDIPAEIEVKLKEKDDRIEKLEQRLDGDLKDRRHAGFRARLVEAGAKEGDLDSIEAFMVDNEIGPKSVTIAVDQFYASREIAEPTGTGSKVWEPVMDSDFKVFKEALDAPAGADLDAIYQPHYEKVWLDMFGAQKSRRPAHMTEA
jgi:hypothetical protein